METNELTFTNYYFIDYKNDNKKIIIKDSDKIEELNNKVKKINNFIEKNNVNINNIKYFYTDLVKKDNNQITWKMFFKESDYYDETNSNLRNLWEINWKDIDKKELEYIYKNIQYLAWLGAFQNKFKDKKLNDIINYWLVPFVENINFIQDEILEINEINELYNKFVCLYKMAYYMPMADNNYIEVKDIFTENNLKDVWNSEEYYELIDWLEENNLDIIKKYIDVQDYTNLLSITLKFNDKDDIIVSSHKKNLSLGFIAFVFLISWLKNKDKIVNIDNINNNKSYYMTIFHNLRNFIQKAIDYWYENT